MEETEILARGGIQPMTDEDKVKRFPGRFKSPMPQDRTLVFPREIGKPDRCRHEHFIIDEAKAEVECGGCGEKLNPMWVLGNLCSRDHRFHQAHKTYDEQMAVLASRSRTKCSNCGKMTRISR